MDMSPTSPAIGDALEKLQAASVPGKTVRYDLQQAINHALKLGFDQSTDLNLLSHLEHAQAALHRMNDARALLEEAIRTRKADALIRAVDNAASINLGYEGEGADWDVVNEARVLLGKIKSINSMAESAIDRVEVELMRQALQQAKELGISLPPALQSAMKAILSLPGDQLRQLRLKRHIQRGDEAGVVASTIDIKTVFFSKIGTGRVIFGLQAYPLLRSSRDFGIRLGIYNPALGICVGFRVDLSERKRELPSQEKKKRRSLCRCKL